MSRSVCGKGVTMAVDVLAIGPHPDDVELGMGGAVLGFKQAGLRVGILDLTTGEPTPHGSPALRKSETADATRVLGVDVRLRLDLPNRRLRHTLAARRQVACMFRRLRPRLVFLPYWEDAHPDHVAATELIEAARFWAKLTKTDMPFEPHFPEKLVYYYSVHLRIHPTPSFILDISEHIEGKMQAIGCYRSQFVTGRPDRFPTLLDDLRGRARYWGSCIGVAYGEAFRTREQVGLGRIDHLL